METRYDRQNDAGAIDYFYRNPTISFHNIKNGYSGGKDFQGPHKRG
jgi:hypothetical protein